MLSLPSWSNAEQENNLINDAINGDAIAQNNLGYNYLYGLNGFDENLNEAIKFLNLAAEQEQVNAMTTIGWIYFTGEFGAGKDFEQAIYWNQRASDLGFTIASYNMGFFYYSGLAGLEQDLSMAKKYWLLSASQWINSQGLHDVTIKELFNEINLYNPKPSEEMLKLRDFFITLLKSEEI
tara:strand:- start:170 stop:709 length:540 start_codon:yes stop_codon:yes gene_type:complete